MTRRSQSFKHSNNGDGDTHSSTSSNNHNGVGTDHVIDVPVSSPRSEFVDSLDRQGHYQFLVQRAQGGVVKSVIHKKVSIGSMVDFGLREKKKKLGQWLFFVFCGACLFLGVIKICVNGWFASTLESAAHDQDLSNSITVLDKSTQSFQSSHMYGHGGQVLTSADGG
uniref:Uncharacterized protein MANES_16G095900 n=1 Tax=Rhizophora mucronata TaxID=61149 RepID=A0A2P2P449_RHIMU